MKNVNKGVEELVSMLSFGWKMFLMNGESFVVLTPTNPLLIFPKMIFL
jgi:hypothetical protein